uniref:Uncharacterized protein n=1 Tax=viral metagenome TaxID=1070528 RepID=A0A6C0KJB7_9ZZZZ
MSISKQASSLFKGLYKRASKHMSGKMVGTGLLYNKWVLYAAFLVSLLNLLVWLVAGDIMNAIVFLLIGFLTSFFSKNMVVVLVFALVVSNVLKFGLSIGQEGFEEGAHKSKKSKKDVDGFEEGSGENGEETKAEDGVDGFEEGAGENGGEVTKTDDDGVDGFEEGAGDNGEEVTKTDDDGVDGFKDGEEGMQTLGYSSVVPTAMFEQQTLFSNLQKMTPLVINTDNESKIRTQLKYESFVSTR